MKTKKVGNYSLHLDKPLGKGNLGQTYFAVNQLTNQKMVMKVMRKKKIHKMAHAREALKLQVKYLSKIKGDHIAQYIDFLETTHNFYIVQEYCQGQNLRQILNKRKIIPQQEVKKYLIQILKGMYQIISRGIIHKDLKPENVLIKDNLLQIADFGLSKPDMQCQQIQEIRDMLYKSPQYIKNHFANYKCDIWSLGIILFQMLYGRYPWEPAPMKQYLSNIQKLKLQFPHNPQVSKGMKKFIMSCLIVSQQQRAEWPQIYQSNLFQQNQLPKFDKLKSKVANIVSSLRAAINNNNLDLQRYFKSLKFTQNQQLNRKAFAALIQKMSPETTEDQIQFLYVQFDKNGDEHLGLQQFKKVMEDFQIKFQGSYKRKADKLLHSAIKNQEEQQNQKKYQVLNKLYQQMIQSLQKKHIYDIYQLYRDSDVKKQGVLCFEDFCKLLRKIDPTLIKSQCQLIFQAFDQNKDKKISFKQFYENMCQITGSPKGLYVC